ncbi:MAG: hypothetical protein ABI480_10650 [Chitinophagaceae bacterium]
MKKTASLIALALLVKLAIAQTGCIGQDLLTIKGNWKKGSDANMVVTNQAKVISHIDAMSELFKSAYPQPKGMEVKWYHSMNGHPVINNGPQPYQYNSLYQSWYCNKTANKVELDEETGTWAYAFVNNFNWFMGDQYDKLLVRVNNQDVYFLPKVVGQWKGYNLYSTSSHSMGQCIILLHNDQLPWKPVTQLQYLQAVRAYWEKSKAAQDHVNDDNAVRTQKIMENTRNNKGLKQEDKDKTIAGLQKDLDALPEKIADNLASSTKYYNPKFKLMDDYITQHSSSLQDPAIIETRLASEFNGSFTTLEKGQMLVMVNPDYFNKRLPAYAAQMIVLYWRWDKNPASMNFKAEFEANFPIDKLKAMIDK